MSTPRPATLALLAALLAPAGLTAAQPDTPPPATQPSPQSGPQTSAETLVVSGVGDTRDDAVVNGLMEAIRQSDGVRVQTETVLRRELIGAVRDGWLGGGGSIERTDTVERETTADIDGLIRGYRILEESRDEASGAWRVRLSVDRVPRGADVQRDGGRRTLAVLPLRVRDTDRTVMRPARGVVESTTTAGEIARRLRSRLTEAFNNTGRFDVLDRTFDADRAAELSRLDRRDTAIAETAKLGRGLGADLVLVGNLEDAFLGVELRRSRLTGRTIYDWVGDLTVDARLIDTGTGRVVWSGEQSLDLDDPEFYGAFDPEDAAEVESAFLLLAADRFANTLADSVDPVKVAAVRDGGERVVLNQGGTRLVEGAEYRLYGRGAQIVDPDTGRVLDTEEVLLGRVRVDRVTAKLAYAELIDGDPGAVTVGATLEGPLFDE